MPQMSSLNWLILFIFFLLILLFFNILNYYSFNLKIKKYILNFKYFIKKWKW